MWEKIILALDVDSEEEARFILQKKPAGCTKIKIGMRLFFALGWKTFSLLPENHQLFLDLKLHDIPSVVEKAVQNLSSYPIWLLTVHCAGGQEMLQRAQKAAGESIGILGVTLLTSLSQEETVKTFHKDPQAVVESFVRLAAECQLKGIVCSAQEASRARTIAPSLWRICPGIRVFSHAKDQSRTATPSEALAAGADYLVLGRELLQAIKMGTLLDFEKHLVR